MLVGVPDQAIPYDPFMATKNLDNQDVKPLILLGAGGHARVLLDVARLCGRRVGVLLDDNSALHGKQIDGVEVAGGIDDLSQYQPDKYLLVNAIGSAGVPKTRQIVQDRGDAAGFTYATLIHPSAVVSQAVEIGAGAQVLAGVVVGPGAVIGVGAILNTKASIDHDTVVGQQSHVAPGATVCGDVTIGSGCHIGCGATLIQGVRVGDNALVAAGAVVAGDVVAQGRVAGIPARSF